MDHTLALALLFTRISLLEGVAEVNYVGCMKRTSGSSSFLEKAKDGKVHIKVCIYRCWERRKKFAGLQGGDRCYCSENLNDIVVVADTECYDRCHGDCQQICGGENTLSIYDTGYVREPTAVIYPESGLVKANIGCYAKYKSLNVLCPKEFAPLETIRMTAQLCIYYCASVHKARFSTTTTRDTCCCSNSVGGAQNTNLRWCNMYCQGDEHKRVKCMGVRKGLLVVSTMQISRLPKFKPWPASVFTNGRWLAPPFPAGEKFRIEEKPLTSAMEDDPSLSGLLAKKMVNRPDSGSLPVLAAAVVSDKAVVSLEGADVRQNVPGGVAKSVAVSEVSSKTEKEAPARDEGNTLIIISVVVGFAIIIIAVGLYIFRSDKGVNDVDSDDDD